MGADGSVLHYNTSFLVNSTILQAINWEESKLDSLKKQP